jgi:hypothetical protein
MTSMSSVGSTVTGLKCAPDRCLHERVSYRACLEKKLIKNITKLESNLGNTHHRAIFTVLESYDLDVIRWIPVTGLKRANELDPP